MKGRHDVGIAKLGGGGSYKLPICVKLKVSNVPIVGYVDCEAKLWKWDISLRKGDHVHSYLDIDDDHQCWLTY
jgi:hypothetical protein